MKNVFNMWCLSSGIKYTVSRVHCEFLITFDPKLSSVMQLDVSARVFIAYTTRSESWAGFVEFSNNRDNS